MPLSHLIALIINVHPYELNGLSHAFTQEKRILIQKRPDFYGIDPALARLGLGTIMMNKFINTDSSL